MKQIYFLALLILFALPADAWFNELWQERVQVNITESEGIERLNQQLEITVDNISECDELRLIKDSEEIIYQLSDANEPSYCKIVFLLNLSASSTATYYIYYDNSEAQSPEYGSLNYTVFNDPSETWSSNSIQTPSGSQSGNSLNISLEGHTILRLDTGIDNVRQYGPTGCMEYFSLAGQYRSTGGSYYNPSYSNQEVIECGPVYCKIRGTSSVDSGKMLEDHTLTVYSTGLVFTRKNMVVSESLSTDDFAYEDGKVGFYIDERGACDGNTYLNVYDNGTLYQWMPISCSGYNNIDTSHYLGLGDWVGRSLSGRGTTFAFFVNHTMGYNNAGEYGELGAVLMHSPNSAFLTVLRQGLSAYHPTALPAGNYSLAGWHKAYCDVILNDSASVPEQDANQIFSPLTVTLSGPQEPEINETNTPPVLDLIPDITVYAGENVTVTPQASDPDNDSITYSISEPVGDDGFWVTSESDIGVHFILVAASDGKLTDNQTVTVTVLEALQDNTTINYPPQLEQITDITINAGENVSISPEASDPNDDSLTISVSEPIGDDGFWQTTDSDVGVYLVNVSATDGVYTSKISFTLNVLAIQNQTPVLNNTTVVENVSVNESEENLTCNKTTSMDVLSTILQHIIKLEELKITFIKFENQAEILRDFYSEEGDTEQADKWQNIIDMLQTIGEEIDILKSEFKEVSNDPCKLDSVKEKISDLVEKVKELLNEIVQEA